MRHTCVLCEWGTYEPDKATARALTVWHVYDRHPMAWQSTVEDRMPDVPRPQVAAS